MLRIFLIIGLAGCAQTPLTEQQIATSKFHQDLDLCIDHMRSSGKVRATDDGFSAHYLVRDCMTRKGYKPGEQ